MPAEINKIAYFEIPIVGSVIQINGNSEIFLVESCDIAESSDQFVLKLINIYGVLINQIVYKRDIIVVSSDIVDKDSLFISRLLCPLCLSKVSESIRLFSVNQLFWVIDIKKCKHCGMSFKDPMPSLQLLTHIYSQNYVHHCSNEKQKQTIDIHRSRVKRLGTVRGRHLDYACGVGGFVEACLKAGWDSYGADPFLPENSLSTQIASRLYKIDAKDEALVEVVGKFDCISIWAGVEHLTHFKETLSGLFKLLNPGGTIVFNSPNAQSLIAKKSGNLWRMATLIEHIQFCTPQSIKYIARAYGLHVQKLRICGSPYPLGKGYGILDQGIITFPFIDQTNSEDNSISISNVSSRKIILSNILKYILGSSGGSGYFAKSIRHIIHLFYLGDHMEVTFKLK